MSYIPMSYIPMSYIPDCRTDEVYNQNFLEGLDKAVISGFDWAVEMAVDNFFDNEMFGLEDENEYLGHILAESIPDYLQETYTMEFTHGDKQPEERTIETYADLIRYKLMCWIEMERNELITSILDSIASEQDDAE